MRKEESIGFLLRFFLVLLIHTFFFFNHSFIFILTLGIFFDIIFINSVPTRPNPKSYILKKLSSYSRTLSPFLTLSPSFLS